MLCKFPIIAILIYLSMSQSSQNTVSPPYYQSPQYTQTLDSIQARFENELKAMNIQLSQIDKIIQNSNDTTNIKMMNINQKIADERNQLYDIQQYLKLPYQLRICDCKVLSGEQKIQLQNKINELNSNINKLQQDINSCTSNNCTTVQVKQIKQQISNLRSYEQYIGQILNSDCCKKLMHFQQQQANGLVDLNQTLYKDNLKATNWYYGNIKQSDYKLQMFQLSTKFNTSTCPLSHPYANIAMNQCQKCHPPQAMFNLGTRSCYYCGGTAFLNLTTSLCQSCPPQNYYNHTRKVCQPCPTNTYLNTSTRTCQSCPLGQYFNADSNQCIGCPQNYQYDTTAKICRMCNSSAGQYFNKSTYKCNQCPTGSHYNPTTTRCQSCSANAFYNVTLGKCVQCPTGYKFDNVYQLCVSTTNPVNNNNPIDINPTNGVCPSTYPYYNQIEKKCEKCPLGQYYEPTSGQCLVSNNIGICPNDRPYFNIKQKKCVPCPAGSTYNPYHYTCVNSQGQAVSHKDTMNNMLDLL